MGVLQSCFIPVASIGAIFYGHYLRSKTAFFYIAVGLIVWTVAIAVSGIGGVTKQFYVLLIARIFTGIGEACIATFAPLVIMKNCKPERQGLWLSLYLSGAPIGTAIGFSVSGVMANSIGWYWTFFLLSLVCFPLSVVCLSIPASKFPDPMEQKILEDEAMKNQAGGAIQETQETESIVLNPNVQNAVVLRSIATSANGSFISQSDKEPHSTTISEQITQIENLLRENSLNYPFMQHGSRTDTEKEAAQTVEVADGASHYVDDRRFSHSLKICLSSVPLLGLCLGYSAYSAVVNGFATFGPSILLGFGFFEPQDTEQSSLVLGVIICVSGIVGTIAGSPFVATAKVEEGSRLESGEEVTNILLRKNCRNITFLAFISLLAFAGLLFSYSNVYVFLSLLSVSLIAIFASLPAQNAATLLSVPPAYRGMAMGCLTTLIHIFGDVPSPVIFGALKDEWGSECNFGKDYKVGTDMNLCADAMRKLIGVASVWLIFQMVGYGISWISAGYRRVQQNTTKSQCLK